MGGGSIGLYENMVRMWGLEQLMDGSTASLPTEALSMVSTAMMRQKFELPFCFCLNLIGASLVSESASSDY